MVVERGIHVCLNKGPRPFLKVGYKGDMVNMHFSHITTVHVACLAIDIRICIRQVTDVINMHWSEITNIQLIVTVREVRKRIKLMSSLT